MDLLKASQDVKKIDGKAFRQALQRLDANKGGAVNMTAEEKQYAGRKFAFADPADTINEFPDVRDRINNGFSDFHNIAVSSRLERFRFASSVIYNTVDAATVPSVISAFITPVTANSISLWTSFVEFGIEGTAFGDSEGIMDFVRSTVGTAWEPTNGTETGLRELIQNNMQAVTGNLTVDQVLDAIENALIEGIFDIP